MASIRRRGNSYEIRVSNGKSGKRRLTETLTWTPPAGMSEARADKEAERQAVRFEDKVKGGHVREGERITLSEFAERWLVDYCETEKRLKIKTRQEYRDLLDKRILPAIGHFKLADIQPPVLLKFLAELNRPGANENQKYKALPKIRETWEASGVKLADTGLTESTLTQVLNRRNVSFQTAEKVSKALGKKIKTLFAPVGEQKDLSDNTISHYFRCVGTIMATAFRWGLIEENPCRRVQAPSFEQKDIKVLELDQVLELLAAAQQLEDMRIKMAVQIFLYTGIRLGELAALQWSDLDLDDGSIRIERAIQYIKRVGLIVSGTKTRSGKRDYAISEDLVDQLRKFRAHYLQTRLMVGDQWQAKDRMTFEESEEQRAKEAAADGVQYARKSFQPVEWVFTGWDGYYLHPGTLRNWIKPFLAENNAPDMTLHGLRHTNISAMIAAGIDVTTASYRAGHAKPSTTTDIYSHFLKRPDKAAAKKLNDLFSLKPRAADK